MAKQSDKSKKVEDLPQPKREPFYIYEQVYNKDGKFLSFGGRKQKIDRYSPKLGRMNNGVKVTLKLDKWCAVQ